MEMTIKEAGAAGVMAAIEDGMMAAKTARENAEIRAALDRLMEENQSLKTTIRAKDAEISKLRRSNRCYRNARAVAYEKVIGAQKDANETRPERLRDGIVWFTCGMISIMALTIIIIKAFG